MTDTKTDNTRPSLTQSLENLRAALDQALVPEKRAGAMDQLARTLLAAAINEEILDRTEDELSHAKTALKNIARATPVIRRTLAAIMEDINMKPAQIIGRYTRAAWRREIAAALDELDKLPGAP